MTGGRGDLASALRAAGGVLLALGAFVVFIRRSSHHRWSDFELLLTLAVPAAVLLAMAVAGRSGYIRTAADPSRSVLLVTAVLLSTVALFQLLVWAGASRQHLLLDAAVLVLTAAIAVFGARRIGAPYAILLAGLALLGAWLLVWIEIVGHPGADTTRWLLVSGGAVLLAAAALMAVTDAIGAAEIATAGGIAAVAAGVLGVIVGAVGLTFGAVGLLTTPKIAGGQTSGWDIYLLLVSVGLVLLAARSGARGPGYVGAFGLLGFLISVGAQLTHLESGRGTSSSLLGWPLVLVLLGLAGLAAPLLRRRAR